LFPRQPLAAPCGYRSSAVRPIGSRHRRYAHRRDC